MKGIDVSGYQGNVDYKKVKKAGYDFVIIKIGNIYDNESNDLDSMFLKNYNNALKNDMKIGFYVYNYCNSIENLKKGTLWAIEQIKDKVIHLPLFLDMEDKTIQKEGKTQLTNQCIEFSKIVEENGLRSGVYANAGFYKNYLDINKFNKNTVIWIAQYEVDEPQIARYDLWQYTDKGYIDGMASMFDCNILENEDILTDKEVEKILTTVKVTADEGLNLRKDATTSSSIIKAFTKGTSLNIYEIKNNWGRTNGGWICLDYTSYSNSETKKYTIGRYEVTCQVLTVRKGAGTNYGWLKFRELSANAQEQVKKLSGYEPNGLYKGTICDVSEIKENWGKIPSGWICLDYCKKV